MKLYLPSFYNYYVLNKTLISLWKESPELFIDGLEIGAVYGSFPGCKWDGGRCVIGDEVPSKIIEDTINWFYDKNIPVRFTFTNSLIEKRHLNDNYCNKILNIANNGLNEILVNSEILEDYIRSNYPNYQIISSTTKCLEVDALKKELEKNYKIVVADSSLNNTEALFQLPHKENIELLVNHYCIPNCPKRKQHYLEVSRCNLEGVDIKGFDCLQIDRTFEQLMKNNPSFISIEDILGKYKEAGFQHFKLDGRSYSIEEVTKSYVYYMIKDIFQDGIRKVLEKCR